MGSSHNNTQMLLFKIPAIPYRIQFQACKHCLALKIVGIIQYNSWYKAKPTHVFILNKAKGMHNTFSSFICMCEMKTYIHIHIRERCETNIIMNARSIHCL